MYDFVICVIDYVFNINFILLGLNKIYLTYEFSKLLLKFLPLIYAQNIFYYTKF